MKANKFVKKFGWDAAIKLSNEMTGITQDVANHVACWGQSEWDYLNRLVKSYELVQGYGGLENATYFTHIGFDYAEQLRLRQAIADVEGCL